jgi:beta-lactamase class A
MTQVMLKKAWLHTLCLFLLTVLLTVGCTGIHSSNREDTSNSQTSVPSETPTPKTDRRSELRDRITQIAQAAQGRVGVTATVLETGESVSLSCRLGRSAEPSHL